METLGRSGEAQAVENLVAADSRGKRRRQIWSWWTAEVLVETAADLFSTDSGDPGGDGQQIWVQLLDSSKLGAVDGDIDCGWRVAAKLDDTSQGRQGAKLSGASVPCMTNLLACLHVHEI
ncbi:hypothetical protein Nepgr_005570 [Nepenthes gracilis]|uniref:Uncharacterized protein n=1 Tax=Nepenthes gracilis TaxID=150966 RepID=A0AAD3S3J6_NEPGR|nr:hypothetical protein Nepgr_005570 [Nepenthes gracilis]